MKKEMPLSEDAMTIIMGIKPDEPGQHGRLDVPMPTEDAIDVIIKIKDMCENFLQTMNKSGEEDTEDNTENEDDENIDKNDMEE